MYPPFALPCLITLSGLCSKSTPKPHAILNLAFVVGLLSGVGIDDVSAAPAWGGAGVQYKGRKKACLSLLLCSLLLFAVAVNSCPAMPPAS